jgi:hypothetical protein
LFAVAVGSGFTAPPKMAPAEQKSLQAAMRRMTVAVLPLEGRNTELAAQMTDLVSTQLSADSGIGLVERARLNHILDEQGIGRSGLVDPATAQHIGYLAGAQALIFGRVFEMDKQTFITARVVGVETGRAFAYQVSGESTQKLAPLAKRLARILITALQNQRKSLVAQDLPSPPEAALAKLVDSLKNKAKPEVLVDIPETHYGAPAVDPAAQTEIIIWLKRAGFKVIDKDAPPEADRPVVTISGEAFSEAAGEFGRFKVARVRVEVKAVNQKTGEVLAVARRIGTNADLSEQVAAKKGLSDEAANIANELIPKLVHDASTAR